MGVAFFLLIHVIAFLFSAAVCCQSVSEQYSERDRLQIRQNIVHGTFLAFIYVKNKIMDDYEFQ